jgi:hypothetical protein
VGPMSRSRNPQWPPNRVTTSRSDGGRANRSRPPAGMMGSSSEVMSVVGASSPASAPPVI